MATWKSIVNDIEARLREDQSSTVTSTNYSTMLGALVNQAKSNVEDSWDWHCLRTVLSFTTSNGTATYTITSSTERSRFFSPSREIYDDTNDGILIPAPDWYIDRYTYIGSSQSGAPIYYRIRGISSGELQITLYPTPTGTYTMRIPMVVPQSDLAADATVLTIPASPVREAAYVLA
ncbi:MAG TPA: hypothetical protein VJ044_17095, partial [Candidatus Hodarchaeales archaeon]|nr:hypothetical protein [Candidatus Hodarchaeales archaeon]